MRLWLVIRKGETVGTVQAESRGQAKRIALQKWGGGCVVVAVEPLTN